MKKIAVALVATNVLASTVMTTLPVQSEAASNLKANAINVTTDYQLSVGANKLTMTGSGFPNSTQVTSGYKVYVTVEILESIPGSGDGLGFTGVADASGNITRTVPVDLSGRTIIYFYSVAASDNDFNSGQWVYRSPEKRITVEGSNDIQKKYAAQTAVNDLFIDNNAANHIKATTDQAAIDAAQAKVNLVTDAATKAALQVQVDKANAELKNEKGLIAATTSVNNLFADAPANTVLKDTTTQAMIDAADAAVDALPASSDKTKLQADVDTANTLFNKMETTTLDALTTDSTLVSGKGEPNADIVIKNGNTIIKSGKVADDGEYSFNIPTQVAGSTITATVTKASNGKTSSASTVVIDEAIATTTISAMTVDSTTVSGKGEPNATVVIKNGTTQITAGKVAEDGTYFFNIAKQAAGSTITATVTKASNGKTSIASTTIPKVDTKLTANDYTIGTATLSGTAPTGTGFVRLWVNNKAVLSVSPSADGSYTFTNVPNFVSLATDKVEVVAVDKAYKEMARTDVVTKGSSVLDNSLTAPESIVIGTETISGTFGSNVFQVRLAINGVNKKQATKTGSNYTVDASDIKNTTDKVEIVAVDAQYNVVARKTVTVKESNVLNVNAYTFGDSTMSGTAGQDVYAVRLWVNGVVKKNINMTTATGVFSFADMQTYVTKSTDIVKVVAVDSSFKELQSVIIQPK